MMPAREVVRIFDLLEAQGLQVWLDGGWGVDALVGTQTRKHDDLDVAVVLAEADAVIA
jgi:lincosamide nucleotidyltransferase A/C/D/E